MFYKLVNHAILCNFLFLIVSELIDTSPLRKVIKSVVCVTYWPTSPLLLNWFCSSSILASYLRLPFRKFDQNRLTITRVICSHTVGQAHGWIFFCFIGITFWQTFYILKVQPGQTEISFVRKLNQKINSSNEYEIEKGKMVSMYLLRARCMLLSVKETITSEIYFNQIGYQNRNATHLISYHEDTVVLRSSDPYLNAVVKFTFTWEHKIGNKFLTRNSQRYQHHWPMPIRIPFCVT